MFYRSAEALRHPKAAYAALEAPLFQVFQASVFIWICQRGAGSVVGGAGLRPFGYRSGQAQAWTAEAAVSTWSELV